MTELIETISNELTDFIGQKYPNIRTLLDYKMSGTLLYLKASKALSLYKGSLGLKCKQRVKQLSDFIDYAKIFAKLTIQKAINNYNSQSNKAPISFEIFVPAIEALSKIICKEYLKRYPSYPEVGKIQEDFINVYCKGEKAGNNDYYTFYICEGRLRIREETHSRGNYTELFEGKPQFKIVSFDKNKLKQLEDAFSVKMEEAKEIVAKLQDKKELELFDMGLLLANLED